MSGFSLGWMAGSAGFAVLWTLHVLWFRLFEPADRPRVLKKLLLALLPIVVAATAFAYSTLSRQGVVPVEDLDGTSRKMLALSIFLFSYFGFLSFYAGVEHSVRVRVAVELYRTPGGALTFQELLARYRPEESTQHRLDQLVAGGYLSREGQGYRLTPKGLVFARLALAGKRFFKIGIGG